MNIVPMFSSDTDEWETPGWLFDNINEVFGFGIDVCAGPHNAKTERYYSKEDNSLAQEWTGVCWMNPPYGRSIGNWVKKAYDSAVKNRATIVSLLPARVDTKWWHDYCAKGEIHFIKGRLKFNGVKNNAPFPSAVVIFRPTLANDASWMENKTIPKRRTA